VLFSAIRETAEGRAMHSHDQTAIYGNVFSLLGGPGESHYSGGTMHTIDQTAICGAVFSLSGEPPKDTTAVARCIPLTKQRFAVLFSAFRGNRRRTLCIGYTDAFIFSAFRGNRGGSPYGRCDAFLVPEACCKMVVDHPSRLHEGIAGGRSDEFKPVIFELPAHPV
jgi:hypothetical protein